MKLTEITSHVRTVSNQNIDIIKTIISLREEEAISKGFTTQEEWKYLLQDRIREIGNQYKIDFHDHAGRYWLLCQKDHESLYKIQLGL